MKKIIIIGAGIIGLSISYYLKKSNFDVIVIEKDKAGMEASYASAGMLAAQSEFDFYEKFMDFCIKSRSMYPDFCKDIENNSGISAEYQKSGMIRPALSKEHEAHFKQNYEWQKNHGFEIEFLSGDELRKIEPKLSKNIISGLYTKNDGQVNNRKLMEALIIANKKNGVKIVENCEVKDYLIKNTKKSAKQISGVPEIHGISGHNAINGVKTNNGNFNADIVVNAAGSWSSLISPKLIPYFEVKPIRGQIVSLQANKKILDKVIFASVLGKGGYIVPRQDNTITLGSTVEDAGFERNTTKEGISSILENCFGIIPELKNLKITDKYCGFRPIASDSLPIIGKTCIENLILATAHYRNGILLAPITAKAVTELVVNDKVIPEIRDFGVERFNK